MNLKAYASYFAYYLLLNFKEEIDKIILFGSVARGEAGKESDVDIFVELKKNKNAEKDIKRIIEDFYKSREALIFKTKGINNRINVIAGKLDDWKELKKSIESNGIILYGKYSYPGKGEKKYGIVSWDKIGRNRGAFLNKLYGFSVKEKRYNGLIENYKGKKLGKSSIMIPVENLDEVMRLLSKYKVNARIIEVYA